MERVQHLKIPLELIKEATNNFDEKNNYIARGGFGSVYKGKLLWSGSLIPVAVKRLERVHGQGDHEFYTEIAMLSAYIHENLVSLIGFSEESGEKILVYLHESRGSLDKYIRKTDLNWVQRLRISIGAARGLNYLHHEVGSQHRVLHRDIKSANILLNEGWVAKISDFGLSRIGPANMNITFLVTNACGTYGYVDPEYGETGILVKESDVYSFGVVLFEILCGRMAYTRFGDRHWFLGPLAKGHYEGRKLDDIINPNLKRQMMRHSLDTFSAIAYQCLKARRNERPTMAAILETLEEALKHQSPKISWIEIWGTNSSGDQHDWVFQLENNHKLRTITIDHGGLVYSLKFTSESEGVLHTSNKFGGSGSGDTVSEIIFDDTEEIRGISGTIGIGPSGYPTISSLSFITNKKTHGPFGRQTGKSITVACNQEPFIGLYGLADYFIYGIGVLRAMTKSGP